MKIEGAKTFARVKRCFSAKLNPPKRWPNFWCDRTLVRCVLANLTQDAGVEIPQRLVMFGVTRPVGLGPTVCSEKTDPRIAELSVVENAIYDA